MSSEQTYIRSVDGCPVPEGRSTTSSVRILAVHTVSVQTREGSVLEDMHHAGCDTVGQCASLIRIAHGQAEVSSILSTSPCPPTVHAHAAPPYVSPSLLRHARLAALLIYRRQGMCQLDLVSHRFQTQGMVPLHLLGPVDPTSHRHRPERAYRGSTRTQVF